MKKLVKKWWFWVIIAFVVIISIGLALGGGDTETYQNTTIAQEQNEFIGLSYYDAMKKLNDYDVTVFHADSKEDYTETMPLFYSEEEQKTEWFVTDATVDEIQKTAELFINHIDYINSSNEQKANETELENKLSKVAAYKAVEADAQTKYENFKLDYIFGEIEAHAVDKDTWYLKAECLVTENGQTVKAVCEAYVTGTTEAPIINEINIL